MGARWSQKDLNKRIASGQIKPSQIIERKAKEVKKPTPPKKAIRDKPLALAKMEEVLRRHGLTYRTEYRFHPVRRFRFDLAIPELKIAFEYEGIMSAKSRHTSLKGYTMDATKYNLAQADGWRIFRYTILNHNEMETDVMKLFVI